MLLILSNPYGGDIFDMIIQSILMENYHPVVKQITDLLDKNKLWYETFIHAPVLTSEEAARTRPGYSLQQGAKALIVKIETQEKKNDYCMLVLPAHRKLDSKKVKNALNIHNFRFATEDEINSVTNAVKRGAIPPFGNLFNIKVYVDPLLFINEKIVFNAGDRRFSVAMKSQDYKKLVDPILLDIHTEE